MHSFHASGNLDKAKRDGKFVVLTWTGYQRPARQLHLTKEVFIPTSARGYDAQIKSTEPSSFERRGRGSIVRV